jgi:hypothetical protein
MNKILLRQQLTTCITCIRKDLIENVRHANPGTVSLNTPQPLLSHSFPVHQMSFPFDVIDKQAALNELSNNALQYVTINISKTKCRMSKT